MAFALNGEKLVILSCGKMPKTYYLQGGKPMKRKRIVTALLTISMESFAKRMGWSSYIVTKDKCGTVGIQKG